MRYKSCSDLYLLEMFKFYAIIYWDGCCCGCSFSFLLVVMFISPVLNFGTLGMCGRGRIAPDAVRRIPALAPAFAKPAKAPRKNSFGVGLFSLTKDKFKPDIITYI
jgi:hypothetical protein